MGRPHCYNRGIALLTLLCCAVAVCAADSTPAAPAPGAEHRYYAPPKGTPPPPVTLRDGRILVINSSSNSSNSGESSSPLQLKAAVWGSATQSQPFSSFVHIDSPEVVPVPPPPSTPPAALPAGGGSSSSNSSISSVLVTAAYQLHRQGFNAIHLPVRFSDLFPETPTAAAAAAAATSSSSSSQDDSSTSPAGSQVITCLQVPLWDVGGSNISSSSSGSGGRQEHTEASKKLLRSQLVPQLAVGNQQQPRARTAGNVTSSSRSAGNTSTTTSAPMCVSLLPNTTTLDRYLWSLQWFIANGLYVIISESPTTAPAASDTIITNSSSSSIMCRTSNTPSSGVRSASMSSVQCSEGARGSSEAWAVLWRAVLALSGSDEEEGASSSSSSSKGRVMLQLSPQAAGQRWEATGSSSQGRRQPGLQEHYLSTMDAVDAEGPGSALFILQGPQQQPQQWPAAGTTAGGTAVGGSDVWGCGFTATPALLRKGLSDPTPLFEALFTKPYRDQVILSPNIKPTAGAGAAATTRSTTASSSGSNTANGPSAAAPSTVATATAAATAAATVAALDQLTEEPEGLTAENGPKPSKVLDSSYRHLSQTGFCVADGNCMRFPVVVSQQQDAGDDGGGGGALQPPEVITTTTTTAAGGASQTQQQQQQDLQLFAEHVLSIEWGNRDGETARGGVGEVPSGDWMFWDMGGSFGDEGLTNTQDVSKRKSDAAEAAGATDQQDKPADDTKGSSISSGGGDGVLSFVYSAGGGAGEDSQDEAMVVDVQG